MWSEWSQTFVLLADFLLDISSILSFVKISRHRDENAGCSKGYEMKRAENTGLKSCCEFLGRKIPSIFLNCT